MILCQSDLHRHIQDVFKISNGTCKNSKLYCLHELSVMFNGEGSYRCCKDGRLQIPQ